MDCQFHLIAILLDGKSDKGLCVIPEIAIQLGDFLLSIGVNALREADFFLIDLEFHIASLLSSALRNRAAPLTLL